MQRNTIDCLWHCFWIWSCLTATACSFTFDESAPELALIGSPPPKEALQKLNQTAVDAATILQDETGMPWLLLREPQVLRQHLLLPPFTEVVVPFTQLSFGSTRLYFTEPEDPKDPASRTRLILRRPGEDGAGLSFLLPPGEALLLPSPRDDAFAYILRKEGQTTFQIFRTEGGFSRQLSLPQGVEPQNPQRLGLFFYDSKGDWFFDRGEDGVLYAHSTKVVIDRKIGKLPQGINLLEDRGQILSCDAMGLRLWPFPKMEVGAPEEPGTLVGGPCNPAGLRLIGDRAYYASATGLRFVSLEGGAEEPVVGASNNAQRILLRVGGGPLAGTLVTSTDPAGLYVNNAGDGWLGERPFMNRGRLVSVSQDGLRLRWLENAATRSGAGDLVGASVESLSMIRMARNVRSYTETRDGRVLAVANYTYRGPHNRVIILDEAQGRGYWVADGANGFLMHPKIQDVVVYLVKDGPGFDVARVPLPRSVQP